MDERLLPEEAIVTTGGTVEKIDDVRAITNFSGGRLGHAIAEELSQAGFKTSVVCSKNSLTNVGGERPEIEYAQMTDTDSLMRALHDMKGPAVIFHAAAVADFKPRKLLGKIDSRKGTPSIELEPTPKILATLRDHFGQESFIVGFKLLSGVGQRELEEVAFNQTKRDRLSLTIANRLEDINGDMHPATIVTQEGGSILLDGEKKEVARHIVKFVLKRADVHWYHTEQVDQLPLSDPEPPTSTFVSLLEFAQASSLLFDSSGNVSVRAGEDAILVTPRHVDKSTVDTDKACIANVNHDTRTVKCSSDGEMKSSIDTAVSDMVYRTFPHIDAILHFHRPWGRADFTTSFPYSCGVREEGEEILRTVDNNINSAFSVEMIHHGFLLGLQRKDVQKLERQWARAVEEYSTHIGDIEDGVQQAEANLQDFDSTSITDRRYLRPVFNGVNIVGLVRENEEDASIFLGEGARGQGLGGVIIDQLIDRQVAITTIDDCDVVDFYRQHGFREAFDAASGLYTLYPPKKPRIDPMFLDVV